VSNVSRLIPESVKMKWHEWREYFKQVERRMIGKGEVKEHTEVTGWGVEEAEARNKKDASE
jgi:N-terminal acetyltransferase 2